MASGWFKSLQCKSRAFGDVSCRGSVQSIQDVVDTAMCKIRKPKAIPNPNKQHSAKESNRVRTSPVRMSSQTMGPADPFFPSMNELPEGHPSRNVVEIIFLSSWGPKPFLGCIEMIFKIQNGSKMVSRFENYREMIKIRASCGGHADADNREENARCVADGNEVMQFYCSGPIYGGGQYFDGGALTFPGSEASTICTFSGSGGAHDNAGGDRGRRSMLVCRVIAGRVSNNPMSIDSLLEGRVRFDSVRGNKGELFVFDPDSVFPCFLIIYKL